VSAPGPLAVRRVGRVLTYRKASTVALLFPPAGIPAMVFSLRASRLAREGDIESARRQGERARDWSWYAVGVGFAVYIVGFVAWLLTANGHAVSRVFFGWSHLSNTGAWKSLLKGFWVNIQVFMIAEVIVLVWALVVAIMRLLPGPACRPMRFLATVYVDVFRGVPSLLVIYIVGLGLAQANVPMVGDLSDNQYAIIALSLTYGAYVSEVYRAGIESVHWSQTAAARSLGLTYTQTMRHDFIGLQKDTALISVLGVYDVVNRARFYNNSRGTLAAYSMAALLFLAVTIPFTRWLDALIRRQQARTLAGR
jgi:polar amino acid transport system permease protein